MRIYLARHGQSCWQVDPSDDWDTSLTELGHEQSRRMADWLATRPLVDTDSRVEVAAVLASPLRRARETAEYVVKGLGLPLDLDDRLREADFHVASHLPRAEHPRLRPATEPTERYLGYRQRVRDAWTDLLGRAEQAEGPVLAVTHGGFVKTLFRIVVGTDDVCLTLYNACLNMLEWRRGRWHLVHLNLWDFLPERLRTK